jgi:hypothetical protein
VSRIAAFIDDSSPGNIPHSLRSSTSDQPAIPEGSELEFAEGEVSYEFRILPSLITIGYAHSYVQCERTISAPFPEQISMCHNSLIAYNASLDRSKDLWLNEVSALDNLASGVGLKSADLID